MTEAQWQRRITDLCDLLGLMWHHETDSRRSKKGFPDLVIAGPNGVIFAELKSNTGKVSDAQQAWVRQINTGGGEAWVWRPTHWDLVMRRLYALAGK